MHLSAEDLQRWHEQGEASDRDRVIGHLAACQQCSAHLAELVRTHSTADADSTFDPAEFAVRGTTFAPAAPEAAGGLRRYWPLAAAAVLILGVSSMLWRPTPAAVIESVTRGDEAPLALTAPVDATDPALAADALTFNWDGADTVVSTRLIVTDLSTPGAPVIDRSDVASGYRPSQEELARLRPGVTYRWFVEYRSSDGLRVTPTRRFQIR